MISRRLLIGSREIELVDPSNKFDEMFRGIKGYCEDFLFELADSKNRTFIEETINIALKDFQSKYLFKFYDVVTKKEMILEKFVVTFDNNGNNNINVNPIFKYIEEESVSNEKQVLKVLKDKFPKSNIEIEGDVNGDFTVKITKKYPLPGTLFTSEMDWSKVIKQCETYMF